MNEESKQWWMHYFPQYTDFKYQRLPHPDEMYNFWDEIYRPFTLFAGLLSNPDNYWRKIHLALQEMTHDIDFPSPFNHPAGFIERLYNYRFNLDIHNFEQTITLLERMPKSSEPLVLLWLFPSVINDPHYFLQILFQLFSSKSWIWLAFLRSDGACDLLYDRLLPYIEPIPENQTGALLNSRLITIEILCQVFIDCRIDQSRAEDIFDKIFNRFIEIFKCCSASLQVGAFRWITKLFNRIRPMISTAQLQNYLQVLLTVCSKNPHLRLLAATFVRNTNALLPNTIARTILSSESDQEVLYFVSDCASLQSSPSIVQQLSLTAINNKIYARTACYLIPQVIRASTNNKWLLTFIKRCAQYIVVAISSYRSKMKILMIIDFLKACYKAYVPEITQEVSDAVSFLINSQKVPQSLLLPMKPQARANKQVLNSLCHQKISVDALKQLLNDTKEEEQKPKPPAQPKVNRIQNTTKKRTHTPLASKRQAEIARPVIRRTTRITRPFDRSQS